MDDLFEKLKAEKPINRNIRYSGKEATEEDNTTIGKINKKEHEANKNIKNVCTTLKGHTENEKTITNISKREIKRQEKTPQKVPTKGEQKYHGNINEKEPSSHTQLLTKKCQVKVRKYSFDNEPNNDEEKEKVSTKAEKKQFNVHENESNLKKLSRSTASTAIDKIDISKKCEETPKTSNKKRAIDVSKEVPVVPAKREIKSEKTKNERKRKSSLTEGTTIKKTKEDNAKKLHGIRGFVVRVSRIDMSKYQSNLIGARRRSRNEVKPKQLNKKANEKITKKTVTAQKEENNKQIGKSKTNKKDVADRGSKKSARKSRSPFKTASPEIKIKLPFLTKMQNRRTPTKFMAIEKVEDKTPKKRGRKPKGDKKGKTAANKNTLSNEELIKAYGKRFFQAKVKIERSKALENMLAKIVLPVKLVPAQNVGMRQMQKNKKRLNVSFVEEVELIGDVEEKKLNSSRDVEKLSPISVEEYILPEDAPTENMERLVLSPSPSLQTPERKTTSNASVELEKIETQIKNGKLEDDLNENSVSLETEKNVEQLDDVEPSKADVLEDSVSNKTEEKINLTVEDNNLTVEEHLTPEKENLVSETENLVAEENANISMENAALLLIEEEVTQTDDVDSIDKRKLQTNVNEEETQADSSLSVLVQDTLFTNEEQNVISLLQEDDCSNSMHDDDGGSLIHNKICNNGHGHDIDLNSEHSNDGVIKNDVMMNGLDISGEINKPVLKNNLDNNDALEMIASDDDFGVSYSPSSFKSANSDMETHAEKGSETKLSDISDEPSQHDDFTAPEIAETVEVSEAVNVPIYTNAAILSDSDVELPAADDVTGLLENIEDIRTKSPLEVERLNATLSLIDGDLIEANWLCNITQNALF